MRRNLLPIVVLLLLAAATLPAADRRARFLPQCQPGQTIEFTIAPDGSVNEVKGLDSLFPEQQQAWQQWVARFALAWALPPDGMKSGEKWKSEQVEPSSTPIAGLQWARDSIYVRDESCQTSQLSLMGDVSPSSGPTDTCAVLLTTAKLKQNS